MRHVLIVRYCFHWPCVWGCFGWRVGNDFCRTPAQGWGGKSRFKALPRNPAPMSGGVSKQFHQGWLSVSSRAWTELEQSWGLWWRWAQKGPHLGSWGRLVSVDSMENFSTFLSGISLPCCWGKEKPWLDSDKWYVFLIKWPPKGCLSSFAAWKMW